jgi:hypothetical protein
MMAIHNREIRKVLDRISSDLTLTTLQRQHHLGRRFSTASEQWQYKYIGNGLLRRRQKTSVPSRQDPQHLERSSVARRNTGSVDNRSSQKKARYHCNARDRRAVVSLR